MKPAHHPETDILAAYAAGALPSGFALVVGAHLEACAQCRGRIAAMERASGEALQTLPRMELGADALTLTLARLEAPRAVAAAPAPDDRTFLDRLPLAPKKWVAPGVWVAAVDTPREAENRVYVLRVGPGAPTARHEHSGLEFCTVLKGAYRDELGLFQAGDFAAAGADLDHQPVIQGDEECICLFATEGRLKPRGVLGRLAFGYADV